VSVTVSRVRQERSQYEKVEEFDVFKLSHSLTLEIYGITKSFPNEEKFGLISQMRKAAYSIPMNLMEGAHRLSSKEYRQFTGIARGPAGEMKYQLLPVRDLNYISDNEYSDLTSEYERVSQMLTRLAKSLE
jgi:four helix bundle protein